LVPALLAATLTSSIEAAAARAITATSSSKAIKPPGKAYLPLKLLRLPCPCFARIARLAFAVKTVMCAQPLRRSAECGGVCEESRRGPAIRAGLANDRHKLKGSKMALYEHVFLARQDLSQAQVDALAASATEIVEQNEGKVTKTETWGLKSLAYKIDRNRKAHFVLLNIDAPGSVVEELERQTRINEDVIRYMTIRVDEHEEGPSVMMRKNDRDRKRRSDREELD
jgi:small subunit ribosomal protein S6